MLKVCEKRYIYIILTTGFHVLSLVHCRHSNYVYFTQNSPFGGMSCVGLCAFRHLVMHKYFYIFY